MEGGFEITEENVFRYMVYGLLALPFAVAFWYWVYVGVVFPTVDDKIRTTLKIMGITEESLFDYYAAEGAMPEPKNGRIPEEIRPYFSHQVNEAPGQDAQNESSFFPIDPFAPKEKHHVRTRLPVGMRSFNFAGDFLRYIKSDNYVALLSRGPNQKFDINMSQFGAEWDCKSQSNWELLHTYSYDATNGVTSGGDIFRVMCKDEWPANRS